MKQNLIKIHNHIEKACDFADRDVGEITLIAVTKNRTVDDIQKLIDLGIKDFGENRVQEAGEKWPALKAQDITLHMIGPLQSNKVKQAKEIFDVLHTVDRASLLKEMIKQDWCPPSFVQVNTGAEEQKSGIASDTLHDFLKKIPWDVRGLMCIPPQDAPASLHFALLKNLANVQGLQKISMGMSMDYEAAIKCGATHIRLGRILFDDL